MALRQAVQNMDVVIHLAGATRGRSTDDFDRINHGGTQQLVDACVQSGVRLRSFVYISSIAAAGPGASEMPLTEDDAPNPVGPYGRSKLLAEQAVLKANAYLPVTVLRPSAIYGPRDTDFLQLFRAVKRGLLPCLWHQELHVDMCYVDDLVQGILAAAECPAARGEVFFLGGAAHTWRSMGHEIARQLGTRPYELNLPRTLALSAATLAESWSRLSGRPSILSRAN
jgi:nucleoside-diphosphate-sugar epimerase